MVANIFQALSVFFFHGIVLCAVRISRRWREKEKERERMHNADLVVVVAHCRERVMSPRQVRNPRVFIALSSLLYDAYHVTIEQMRCGYVLV